MLVVCVATQDLSYNLSALRDFSQRTQFFNQNKIFQNAYVNLNIFWNGAQNLDEC